MPKTTLASVLLGIVAFAAALALTAIEWVDDRPAADRVRALIQLGCVVAVFVTCAASTTPHTTAQLQPVTTVTVTAVYLKGAQR